jgi:hypothetical protein
MDAQRSGSIAYLLDVLPIELAKLMPLKDYHYLRRRLEAEESDLPDSDLIEQVHRKLYIGLKYIPKHALSM